MQSIEAAAAAAVAVAAALGLALLHQGVDISRPTIAGRDLSTPS